MIVIKSVITVMTFDFIEWTAWLDSMAGQDLVHAPAPRVLLIAGNDRRMYPATDYLIKYYIYDIWTWLDGWTAKQAGTRMYFPKAGRHFWQFFTFMTDSFIMTVMTVMTDHEPSDRCAFQNLKFDRSLYYGPI
jgi:hypothetical protein